MKRITVEQDLNFSNENGVGGPSNWHPEYEVDVVDDFDPEKHIWWGYEGYHPTDNFVEGEWHYLGFSKYGYGKLYTLRYKYIPIKEEVKNAVPDGS